MLLLSNLDSLFVKNLCYFQQKITDDSIVKRFTSFLPKDYVEIGLYECSRYYGEQYVYLARYPKPKSWWSYFRLCNNSYAVGYLTIDGATQGLWVKQGFNTADSAIKYLREH